MRKFLRKIFRKKPVSIALNRNFPALYEAKKDITLHEPISAIIAGIEGMWAFATTYGPVVAGVYVGTYAQIMEVCLIAGTSLYSHFASQKSMKPTALNTHGLQINTEVTYVFYRGNSAS